MLCMVLGALVLGLQNRWQNFVWATSLFTHQFQAEPCRCSRRVALINGQINSQYVRNLISHLISLAVPLESLLSRA